MPYDLREALQIINSGRSFDIEVVSANVKKKSGGEVLSYKRCRLARTQPSHDASQTERGGISGNNRNANHAFNFTRNIKLANSDIKTIHPLLILSINNVPLI